MSDDETVQRFTRCLASYARHLALSMNGQLIEREHVVLSNPRLASKARNMIVPLRTLSADESEELRDLATQLYGERDGWTLWSVSDQPRLGEAGFRRYPNENPVMVSEQNAFANVGPIDGLEITKVETDDDVLIFEQVRERARDAALPDNPAPGAYFDARVLAPNHQLWVGWIAGQPVVTGALFEDHGVSLLKNLAVVPEWRGKGLAKAMISYRLELVAGTAVCDADPPSRELLRNAGFRDIEKIRFWWLA